ncbi:cell division protein FtsQ/DivIB [Pilimelia columellifera]|uniref:POTRA domain-containing protein n=1 Tax=Pilimelia columellifera subsp. columellifera TaxID=706583 RepID=A0ABP6AJT9_9ACTN
MTEPGRRRWRLVRARTDAVPDSVRRFSQRARRRRLRAAAPWLTAFGVAALLAAGLWIVYDSPLFGVRAVKVSGVAVLTPYEVSAAADIRLGRPLARVDLAAARQRVETLPAVERVEVSRDWPAVVRVRVWERTAVAAAPSGRAFLLFDGAGVVFQQAPQRPAGLPLVRLARPGPADLPTTSALRVLTALPPELSRRVRELVVESPARITLRLLDGRVVFWGDAADSEAKARTTLALLSRQDRRIDVSAPDVVTTSR